MASPVHCAGIALAVVAILLFSQSSPEDEDRTKTSYSIRTGIISGMGYGFADLFLGLMTTDTAEGGLAVARITGASLAIGLLLTLWLVTWLREPVGMSAVAPTSESGAWFAPWDANLRIGLLLCALAGFLDCLGQLGYVLSATQGQISVAAALVAMYPPSLWDWRCGFSRNELGPLSGVDWPLHFLGLVFWRSSARSRARLAPQKLPRPLQRNQSRLSSLR